VRGAPAALRRVIVVVVVLGALTSGGVAVAASRADGPAWTWVLALVALTTAGELVYVRLRHGEATEELTLFEAAVVVDVLLLPPGIAVLVPVVALAIASAVRRRPLVKALFNLGAYSLATASLVVVHAGVGGDRFGPRGVIGVTVAVVAFAGVNLFCLSRVIAVVDEADPWTVLRDGAPLSLFMALGNVALGTVAVAVAESTPALLPFTALPAVALTFAYRKAAREADERARATQLLVLSQTLAGGLPPDELVTAYLRAARAAFRADSARAELGGVVTRDGEDGGTWRQVVEVPVEAEGRRLGSLTLACREKGGLTGGEALLTPLANALGVALVAAQQHARLVEETSKLTAVVEQASEGILVVDAAGRVLLWNAALALMTGVAVEDAGGRDLAELVRCAGADGAPLDLASVLGALTLDAPQQSAEMVVTRPDGEQRWLRVSLSAIHDEGVRTRVVAVAHDVTRERQVDRLKGDFIATISHELRTPLTPIKGYVDLLRRRGDTIPPEKRTEMLDTVADRVGHLGRLVEDLLFTSRVTESPTHSVQLAPADLAALVRRTVDDFSGSAGRLRLSLPEGTAAVTCDPTRTVQVVGNLVSNALKYSPAGAPVEVAVSVHDGSAAVTVSDLGRGIPADQLEAIFDKFHRVEDPLTMTTGGTGLGLYIARALAEAMGGTITVHSALGVGSTFTFTLPRAEAEPRAVAETGSARATGRPPLPFPRPRPAAGSHDRPLKTAVS
jgi:PAS domain S-box-containing protein